MNVQTWLDNPKTIRKSRKMYAHFDHRVDIKNAQNLYKILTTLQVMDFIHLFIIR